MRVPTVLALLTLVSCAMSLQIVHPPEGDFGPVVYFLERGESCPGPCEPPAERDAERTSVNPPPQPGRSQDCVCRKAAEKDAAADGVAVEQAIQDVRDDEKKGFFKPVAVDEVKTNTAGTGAKSNAATEVPLKPEEARGLNPARVIKLDNPFKKRGWVVAGKPDTNTKSIANVFTSDDSGSSDDSDRTDDSSSDDSGSSDDASADDASATDDEGTDDEDESTSQSTSSQSTSSQSTDDGATEEEEDDDKLVSLSEESTESSGTESSEDDSIDLGTSASESADSLSDKGKPIISEGGASEARVGGAAESGDSLESRFEVEEKRDSDEDLAGSDEDEESSEESKAATEDLQAEVDAALKTLKAAQDEWEKTSTVVDKAQALMQFANVSPADRAKLLDEQRPLITSLQNLTAGSSALEKAKDAALKEKDSKEKLAKLQDAVEDMRKLLSNAIKASAQLRTKAELTNKRELSDTGRQGAAVKSETRKARDLLRKADAALKSDTLSSATKKIITAERQKLAKNFKTLRSVHTALQAHDKTVRDAKNQNQKEAAQQQLETARKRAQQAVEQSKALHTTQVPETVKAKVHVPKPEPKPKPEPRDVKPPTNSMFKRDGEFKVRPKLKLADGAKIGKFGSYTYAFWVKPTGRVANWGQLLMKGNSGRQRGPGIWFYPHRTRLHVRSSTTKGWNTGADPSMDLPMNRWTHVAVTHTAGALVVYVNGKKAASAALPGPLMNDGNLWGSRSNSANAYLADVRYFGKAASAKRVAVFFKKSHAKYAKLNQQAAAKAKAQLHKNAQSPAFSRPGSFALRANHRIAKNAQLKHNGQYSVSFWLKPKGTRGGWHQILVKGDGGRRRAPGVWFYPGSTKLHIRSGTSKHWNHGSDPSKVLEIGKWIHVTVRHRADSMQVFYDGKLVSQAKIPAPLVNADDLWASRQRSGNADIAEINWFNAYISDAKVKQLYDATKAKYPNKQAKAIGNVEFSRPGSFALRPNHRIAKNAQLKHNGQYSVSFWLKPKGTRGGWHQILVKGDGGRRRAPGIWFYPGSTKLHIRSGTSKHWNHGSDPSKVLEIGKWIHVTVRHRANSMQVFYDGKLVSQAKIPAPLVNKDDLWASRQRSGNADIAEINWFNSYISDAKVKQLYDATKAKYPNANPTGAAFSRPGSFAVRANNRIANNAQLKHNGQYSVSFWLKPKGTRGGWHQILVKGDGSRRRAPGVWFYPGSTKLHIRSGTSKNWNHGSDPSKVLKIGKWIHVTVRHRADSMQVFYDGKLVSQAKIPAPLVNKDDLWASRHRSGNADIAEINWFNTYISDAKVKQLYDATKSKYS